MDPVMQMLFQSAVLPAMQQMPTEQLTALRDYLNGEVDAELLRREMASRSLIEGPAQPPQA